MKIKNKRTQSCSLIFLILLGIAACSNKNELISSPDDILPHPKTNEIDVRLNELYKDYNCRVEYRYVENLLPRDWYNITPVEEKYVIPMAVFLKRNWILPLEAGSSHKFVAKIFPTQLVLVGSPAFQKDGMTEVLGEAEGGTLLRFTRVNSFNPENPSWVEKQLTTAFHEYAHILHQTYRLPDEFRKVTPNSYTKNGWMTIQEIQALTMGMVTPYATSSVQEDFAELFAFYIVQPEHIIKTWFEEKKTKDFPNIPENVIQSLNNGSAILRIKLEIMKKMLSGQGLDMDKIREDLQVKLK